MIIVEDKKILNELVHPGKILADILDVRKISKVDFADYTGINVDKLNNFLEEKIPVTPDLAEKFSVFFGNSSDMWIGLQNDFDIGN